MLLIKAKSIKQSSLVFLYGTVTVACLLFIFQDIFLAAALFINRQIKTGSLQKAYVIKYMTGTRQTRENILPFDIAAKQISRDHKLTNKLYQPSLQQDDTVTLKFDKGLFGIAFQPQHFRDR